MPIIRSYNITTLLEDYVEGTRQWLYDDVRAWLDATNLSGSSGAAGQPQSRMYLLLGGPGMGKSVFSAVMHTKLISRSVKRGNVELVRGTLELRN